MFDDVSLPLAGCVLGAVLISGCAWRGNSELLEAQLRKQEMLIGQYERETSRLQSELTVSRREMDLLRSELATGGGNVVAEETTRSLAKVSGLVFNSLLTAGQSRDELSGDERFHAVFYPHDDQGEIVKLSGKVELEALDLGRTSDQRSLGRWEFSSEESRKLWLAGFLTSGFQVDEAWQSPPVGSKVLLVARLTTLDGRVFEATHTIPIEPISDRPGAPQILPQQARANIIEPASFNAPAQVRPVPDPQEWEFEIRPAVKRAPQTAGEPLEVAQPPAASQTPAALPSAAAPPLPRTAPPFPDGTRTSDNWSEETLPIIR